MGRPDSTPLPKQQGTTTRLALVPAQRLSGWVDRFAAGHGPLQEEMIDDGLVLQASDGAVALLRAPWPVDGRPGRGASSIERLASLATQERGLGILLVRRGGFAVAAASGQRVLASKGGKRYADARTTAGYATEVFAGHLIEYIVPGGDRALVDQVLAEPSLGAVAGRTRLALLDIQDPKPAVLQKAAAESCAIRITVTNPPPSSR
ncbi:hypothetical protein NEK97_00710 [Paenarthrobacter sp. UW852]|uniref:Vms1/Ankzf1 family peptidyl-tRNA hydrolase n=1 Tax=Paenarthrobacter sp. UW852 TaxID=2951989 RepID=UPI002147BA8C|nr:Vms1/Ankzf1 family peptidyl-tRNA hydrolase [Paenarthrobacter sp. UW852]MCR1159975.1 hypothetical protein [Paenarthrobacter sp. UW852]